MKQNNKLKGHKIKSKKKNNNLNMKDQKKRQTH